MFSSFEGADRRKEEERVRGLMLRNLFVFICVMYPRSEGSVEIS